MAKKTLCTNVKTRNSVLGSQRNVSNFTDMQVYTSKFYVYSRKILLVQVDTSVIQYVVECWFETRSGCWYTNFYTGKRLIAFTQHSKLLRNKEYFAILYQDPLKLDAWMLCLKTVTIYFYYGFLKLRMSAINTLPMVIPAMKNNSPVAMFPSFPI